MFERFSLPARSVIVHSQQEARALDHPTLGTEHLLLGLFHDDGPALGARQAEGLSLDATRVKIDELVGSVGPAPSGSIPFTDGTKRALERSLRESLRLRQADIAPEHILLALTDDTDSTATAVLAALGVQRYRLRASLLGPLRRLEQNRCSLCGRSADRAERVIVGRAGSVYCEHCIRDTYRLLDETQESAARRIPFHPVMTPPPDAEPARVAIQHAFNALFAEIEGCTATVTDVWFINEDEARVLLGIQTPGGMTIDTDGYAERDVDIWIVSPDTVDRLTAMGAR